MALFIPITMMFTFLGAILLTIKILKRYHQRKKRRSPFTDHFWRAPGESLLIKIEEINIDLNTFANAMISIPVLLYASYITDKYFRQLPIDRFSVMLYLFVGSVFSVYCLIKIVRLFNLRRTMRLGYDGEIAVAQELNQMMRHGYFVFHDFVAEKFNIDHVVVGSTGVYAIETKTRAKRISDNTSEDAKVTYDGKRIHFPKWKEVKPLEQAKRQATWLEKWLSSATGEKTPVRPVVALPGWFITRTSSDGIAVINPKQFRSIAKPINQLTLDESQVKRIVHQLESRCRNIESNAVNGLGGSGS